MRKIYCNLLLLKQLDPYDYTDLQSQGGSSVLVHW